MQVELGNPKPHELPGGTTNADGTPTALPGPQVTYVSIPDDVRDDGVPHYGYEVADSAKDLAHEVAYQRGQGDPAITQLPNQEAVIAVAALWSSHGSEPPSWVWSDSPEFAVLLGEFFRCPVGRPDDLEDTHWTHNGAPGVGPPPGDPVADDAPALETSEG